MSKRHVFLLKKLALLLELLGGWCYIDFCSAGVGLEDVVMNKKPIIHKIL